MIITRDADEWRKQETGNRKQETYCWQLGQTRLEVLWPPHSSVTCVLYLTSSHQPTTLFNCSLTCGITSKGNDSFKFKRMAAACPVPVHHVISMKKDTSSK